MKLLHTADLHIGAPFASLGGKGDAQRQQLLATLERIVDLAADERVDAVLVAGDLFDSVSPSPRAVDRVRLILSRLSAQAIRVFIIPGTHDCFGPSSVWRHAGFENDLVTVFTETGSVTVPELDLTVHGLVVQGRKAPSGVMSALRRGNRTGIEIGLAHGSLSIPGLVEEDCMIFTGEEARATAMDYLALGHWHSFARKDFGEVVGCYPGSPEMIASDQRGAGSVALVTIDSSGDVEVEQRNVGLRRFESLEISVDAVASAAEIEERVRDRADENLVLEVVLSGLCSLDLELDAERMADELAGLFFVLKIKDRSHPPLDDASLSGLSAHTVAGRFAEIMRERIEKATNVERVVYEEALRLGVALLEGRAVLE